MNEGGQTVSSRAVFFVLFLLCARNEPSRDPGLVCDPLAVFCDPRAKRAEERDYPAEGQGDRAAAS